MSLLVLQNKTITRLNSRVERLEKEKWNPYRQIWDLRMQLYHMEQSIESNFTERLGFLENSTTGSFTLRGLLTTPIINQELGHSGHGRQPIHVFVFFLESSHDHNFTFSFEVQPTYPIEWKLGDFQFFIYPISLQIDRIQSISPLYSCRCDSFSSLLWR